jgi:hypothetical protein
VTADPIAGVHDLLAASLRAWRVDGSVARCPDGTLALTTSRATLMVSRGSTPFRWMVTMETRRRGVTSVAGLLRTVRRVLDPDHQPNRLRIAPSRLMPP